eukprot:1188392-Prorocentrum_minimum.AAC.2
MEQREGRHIRETQGGGAWRIDPRLPFLAGEIDIWAPSKAASSVDGIAGRGVRSIEDDTSDLQTTYIQIICFMLVMFKCLYQSFQKAQIRTFEGLLVLGAIAGPAGLPDGPSLQSSCHKNNWIRCNSNAMGCLVTFGSPSEKGFHIAGNACAKRAALPNAPTGVSRVGMTLHRTFCSGSQARLMHRFARLFGGIVNQASIGRTRLCCRRSATRRP